MKKLYTVTEAEKTLPYVSAVTAELCDLYREIQVQSRLHNATPKAEAEKRRDLRARIKQRAERLHECQEELLALGLLVKDYELGLVDFPSELEGRPILLCWEQGEERVSHWHEVDAGYRGRRPVPEGAPGHWPLNATASPAGRD